MARLSLQQYEILAQQRGAFDDWIRSHACRNLPIPWLRDMNNVFMQVFKAPPVDYSCTSCLGHALTRLHGALLEYETEQANIQAELEKKAAQEALNSKPKGSKAKDWIRDAPTK
jgi:hypothetical protein